ncbi:MAG: hypothetical protein H7A23_23560 [Leptospiraceae bacterium]|nr:hypothetical protein [Leptospiraceae bacterium]MCP5497541.1 hypothetical protein [Leptospiraceae bacterium]
MPSNKANFIIVERNLDTRIVESIIAEIEEEQIISTITELELEEEHGYIHNLISNENN